MGKTYQTVKGKRQYTIGDAEVSIGSVSKTNKIARIIEAINTPQENTIIYCGSRAKIKSFAKGLLKNQQLVISFQYRCETVSAPIFNDFLAHLEKCIWS